MDDSSVGRGRDYSAFQRIYYDLDDALHIIVDGKERNTSHFNSLKQLLRVIFYRLLHGIQ